MNNSSAKDFTMIGKLGLLLFFLQLWHFATPNKTLETVPLPPQTVIPFAGHGESNFPYQIGNKFYYIENDLRVNWYQAAENCRKIGGNLLNFESTEEMDMVLSITTPGTYWISANCLAGSRKFTSITTGEAMPYFRWRAGEPNNQGGTENCVTLITNELNDDTCTKPFRYICEAKIMY